MHASDTTWLDLHAQRASELQSAAARHRLARQVRAATEQQRPTEVATTSVPLLVRLTRRLHPTGTPTAVT